MFSHPVLMKSNGQKASEKQFNTGVKYLRRTRASYNTLIQICWKLNY